MICAVTHKSVLSWTRQECQIPFPVGEAESGVNERLLTAPADWTAPVPCLEAMKSLSMICHAALFSEQSGTETRLYLCNGTPLHTVSREPCVTLASAAHLCSHLGDILPKGTDTAGCCQDCITSNLLPEVIITLHYRKDA